MLRTPTSGRRVSEIIAAPGDTPWTDPVPMRAGTEATQGTRSTRSAPAITGWRQRQRENPAGPVASWFTARGTTRKMSTDAVATRIKIHAATAAAACPRIAAKNVTPHVLRHSFAMRLQSSGAGGPSIALLLGHESLSSTRPYLHADLELKQKAWHGRYTPPDKLLAFLESL